MTTKPQSKKWHELGVITKNVKKVKDANGDLVPVKDKSGNDVTVLGFKLSEKVTILVDGQPVETSGFGNLITPIEEVESLYKNGVIGDDKIEERREKAKNAHSWLRYKIQLTPPKSTQK